MPQRPQMGLVWRLRIVYIVCSSAHYSSQCSLHPGQCIQSKPMLFSISQGTYATVKSPNRQHRRVARQYFQRPTQPWVPI